MCVESEFTTRLICEVETQTFLFAVSLDRERICTILQEDSTVTAKRLHLRQKCDRLQTAAMALRNAAPEVIAASDTRRIEVDSGAVQVEDSRDHISRARGYVQKLFV